MLDVEVDLLGDARARSLNGLSTEEGRDGEEEEHEVRKYKNGFLFYGRYKPYDKLTVHWVTEAKEWNGLRTAFIAPMGNEPILSHYYIAVCLLIAVGPPGKRVLVKEDSVEDAKSGEEETE